MKSIELVFLVTNATSNTEIDGKVTEGVKKEVESKTDHHPDINLTHDPIYSAFYSKLDRMRWDETNPNLDYDEWNQEEREMYG